VDGIPGKLLDISVISTLTDKFILFAVLMFLLRQSSTIESGRIRSIRDEWALSVLPLGEWRKTISNESMNLFIHVSLSNIWSLMMLVMMSLLIESSTVESRWIRSIGNERILTSFKSVEWWKSMPHETVNLLVHSSLSYILLMMLSVMFVLIKSCTLMSRWIRAVRNECLFCCSVSDIKRRNILFNKLLNFFVISSLANILLMVFVMVLLILLGSNPITNIISISITCHTSLYSLECFIIGSIWNKRHSTSHSGVKWRNVLFNELLDLFVISSLANILLVMLAVMLVLIEGGTLESCGVGAVGDERASGMLPLSKWREAVGDKAVHFLLHTSLRHVRSLMVLAMVLVVTMLLSTRIPFLLLTLVNIFILMPLSMYIGVILGELVYPWVHILWRNWISFMLSLSLNERIGLRSSLTVVCSSDIWESKFSRRLWRSGSMGRIRHGVHAQVQNVDTLSLITDGRSGKSYCLARGK
jgi:hypothetical protein